VRRLRAAAVLATIVFLGSFAGVAGSDWTLDPEVSWYGPNLYGNRTACGQTLTPTLEGVAHRSLPCGTLVSFRWQGRTVTVPVIDRGPAAWTGRRWDLTRGACIQVDHCHTGPIEWKLGPLAVAFRAEQRTTLPPTDTQP
jgi:rare lipoprotein A (peptidoglycan hydrolase)